MQRMDRTHGNVELCQIWGHMSEHRCSCTTPDHLLTIVIYLVLPSTCHLLTTTYYSLVVRYLCPP